MGIAIKCMLEQRIPGTPHMEWKSLAMGYCSEACGAAGADTNPDIIAVDFKSGQTRRQAAAPSAGESLLSPLDTFIAGDGAVQWHDAAKGLVAVRNVLTNLKKGAIIAVTPDFEFADGDEDLTEGVRYDLEELEKIFVAAQNAGTRFYLAFDI
jgi:hypothetical protein